MMSGETDMGPDFVVEDGVYREATAETRHSSPPNLSRTSGGSRMEEWLDTESPDSYIALDIEYLCKNTISGRHEKLLGESRTVVDGCLRRRSYRDFSVDSLASELVSWKLSVLSRPLYRDCRVYGRQVEADNIQVFVPETLATPKIRECIEYIDSLGEHRLFEGTSMGAVLEELHNQVCRDNGIEEKDCWRSRMVERLEGLRKNWFGSMYQEAVGEVDSVSSNKSRYMSR